MSLLFNVKSTDVHLVNDKLIARGHLEGIIAPIKGLRLIDNSIASGVRHFSGIRVDAGGGGSFQSAGA